MIDNGSVDPRVKLYRYTFTAKLRGLDKPVVIQMTLDRSDGRYSSGLINAGGDIDGLPTITVESYVKLEDVK